MDRSSKQSVYESKGLLSNDCFELLITRNYFGVKHGKGPSDWAGAHFKNFVTGVVKSKKALLVTVEELAKYSTNYDCQVDCNGDHEHYENSKGTNKVHNLLKVITHSTQFQGKSSNTLSHTKVYEKFIPYEIQALRGLLNNVTCHVVALIAYLVQMIAFFQSMLTSGH